MVIVFEAQDAETLAGKPVAAPTPVAPEVVCVILVRAVLIHKVGLELAAPTVIPGVTVIAPDALLVTEPQGLTPETTHL